MTAGQELEKITGLKLFHNHMTIELLESFFGFSSEVWDLSNQFRTKIFREIAKCEGKGLTFTYVWAFDQQEDWDYVDKICEIEKENHIKINNTNLSSVEVANRILKRFNL